MKAATKLQVPVMKRLELTTDLYEIIELKLMPGTTEMLEVSARNPRREPVEFEISLEQMLRYLTPELFGDQPEEPEEEYDESEEEDEKELEEPEPCEYVRKKTKTKDQTYDEWVEELFLWKARQRKKKGL